MKDRRKRDDMSWNRFFWCTIFVVLSCVLFTGFTFSSFRLFGDTLHPVLVSPWRTPAMDVTSGDSPATVSMSICETVLFPDQAVVFLKYPSSTPLFTIDDLDCVHFSLNSSQPPTKLHPMLIDGGGDPDNQIVRCPLPPPGLSLTVAVKSNGQLSPGPTHQWDSLAYDALVDRDNTTIVFVKGLNLRPERVADASRFECVYGWDFSRPKFFLRSGVVSAAQEIVRCRTPLSVLNSPHRANNSMKVSVRIKGRGVLQSMARPKDLPELNLFDKKPHQMCICTMVRNQARFLREWVMYHGEVGVERWFVYDNNSDDDIESEIELLQDAKFNITRHSWPWIKTQEAGFAHCALRAREACEWLGFIDVDEFFHLPSGLMLHDVLEIYSGSSDVAELRSSCYSFGPSGLKHVPLEGVMLGYTCRLSSPERHKSIVRPEALNSTLINVVHHFHLSDGFRSVNVNRSVMVINHYKYQVWEVFEQKFYRRVAAYVADWLEEENVGSKDRAPGLGTKAVEPPDWSTRFCEVTDTGLRDRVLQIFADPHTHLLPWQERPQDEEENEVLVGQSKSSRKRHQIGLL